jgi:hypothetical protein
MKLIKKRATLGGGAKSEKKDNRFRRGASLPRETRPSHSRGSPGIVSSSCASPRRCLRRDADPERLPRHNKSLPSSWMIARGAAVGAYGGFGGGGTEAAFAAASFGR